MTAAGARAARQEVTRGAARRKWHAWEARRGRGVEGRGWGQRTTEGCGMDDQSGGRHEGEKNLREDMAVETFYGSVRY